MATRKRSKVWEFFSEAEDSRFGICVVCSKEIPRGGDNTKTYTTTNLVQHLKSKHTEEYSKYEELQSAEKAKGTSAKGKRCRGAQFKQLTLAEAEELHKPWDINDQRAKLIHVKIGEMIARDCQPYSVVEDAGFNALVHVLEPRYHIPSRKYFRETVIPGIVKTVEAKIKTKLEGVNYISFTTDVWSSEVNRDSLLSLTAHWVDDTFHRFLAVLQVQPLEQRHTGEYIAMKISKSLSDWDISSEQVHCVVRDNGSNMIKAMDEACLPSFGCFAHTLQLVIHDGLLTQRIVIDLLAVCRSIVGHFKHSSVAYHKLATIQENLQLPKHTLKQDVSTRWNSSLYMIQSILEQKMALAAYAADNDIQQLTASQLEIARKMTLVLEPVEEITQVISKETATLSMIIPFVRVLLRTWEREEDDRGIRTMKLEMIKSLKSRFAGIEDNKLLCLATLLDPRFKDKFFVNNIARVSAKEMLEEELGAGSAEESEGNGSGSVTESRNDSTQTPSPKRQKRDSLLAVVTDILDNSSSRGSSTTTSELDRYLQEPVLDYKLGNPFIWWGENKARFPGLATIAQRSSGY